MLERNIEKYFNQIVALGSRASGSWEELKAAERLRELLAEMGIEADMETFSAPSHLAESSSLVDSRGREYPSLPSQFSPAGTAEGKLIFVGNCHTYMFDDNYDLSDKIGLLNPSGTLQERIDCILDLEKRGLGALIVVGPAMDLINSKVIRYPEVKRLPSAIVSWRTANKLKKIEGESISLSVTHCERKRNESINLVGKIEGSSNTWLTVSAHIDTTPFTVGANDDASGCALLLELAHQLAKEEKPQSTIYFLFSGSEEYGGVDLCGAGAEAFYSRRQDKLENCIAHIDIDDVGHGIWPFEIYFGGNKPFRDIIEKQRSNINCRILEKNNPSCDHGAACKRSIPFAWFTNSQYPCPSYHTPEDSAEFFHVDMAAKIFPTVKNTVKALSTCKPFFPYIRDGQRLIRPARFSDIEAIKHITKLAFEPVSMDRMFQDFFNEAIGGKEWYEYKNASLEKQCKSNIYQVIVCEIDDKVVGYATMHLDFQRGIAEIGNNAVHPDFQRRGIGKAMQQEIMRRMLENGFNKFKVNTLSNDISAQKVYEKLGFEKYIESYHYLKKLEK